ncbi:MAG: hypothetical protein ACYTEZ_18675 [Planctomycetota bacterium]|jgi:hypothetical protein
MRASMLEKEIDTYLSETEALHGAQGGDALQGVTIHARFTAVFQGTVGQSGNFGVGTLSAEDIGVVDGRVDLDFNFQVTDNLTLFIDMTANNGGAGSFPANYFPTRISVAPTAGGFTDGIGVNGTVPIKPGSVTTQQAGIRLLIPTGNTEVWSEMGELNPRDRFMQSRFADDQYTGFINNNVDDNPAIPYLTNAGGTVSLGWHITVNFGDNKQYSVNFGWFAPPGQWFAHGQFMFQFSWKGQISGRETNVRLMGFWQNLFQLTPPLDDSSAGGGVVWDWDATDQLGIFVKIAVNGADINPVELDGSVGVVWTGIIGSRPDDAAGVSVGFITSTTR